MTKFGRAVGLTIGLAALTFAAVAGAQENLDKGKNGAQLYAADCVACHKAPQKLDLGKAGGLFGLESFLRAHYTASRESSTAVAAYLKGVQQPAPAKPARSRPRKPADGKPSGQKPSDAKSAEAKPSDAKPSDAKPSDAKPSDIKPSDAKSADAKPSDAKPAKRKPAKPKAGEGTKPE